MLHCFKLTESSDSLILHCFLHNLTLCCVAVLKKEIRQEPDAWEIWVPD